LISSALFYSALRGVDREEGCGFRENMDEREKANLFI
jgi:hypothetical protein